MYRFIRVALPLLLILVLAACAAPPTQAPPQAEQPAQPAQPAAPAADATPTPVVNEYGSGQLQLIFWNGLTGADGVTMQAMVEQFVADNPDISVRMVSDKVESIERSGADTLLAGDLGCLLNMAGRLKRLEKPVKVRHVAEVLAGMTDAVPPIGEAKA